MSENDEINGRKRPEGAPKGNSNARKSGFFAARRALNEFGLRAIDGRSAVGIALREFRASVITELGGPSSLSRQQLSVLDVLCRTKLMLDSLDNYILSLPSLADRRKRAVLPVVRERVALAESFVRHLQVLGLGRKAGTVPSLSAYIQSKTLPASISQEKQAIQTTTEEAK